MTIKEIFELQLRSGSFGYGFQITREKLCELFNIETVSDHDIEEMDDAAQIREAIKNEELQVLQVFGLIKQSLLNEGKYFMQSNGVYVVAMPSTNVHHAKRQFAKASRCASMGEKLLKNTPVEYCTDDGHESAKAILLKKQIKERKKLLGEE